MEYKKEENNLRKELSDWTDCDIAAFILAQSIGLMSPDVRFHLEAKHVFWSANIVGETLYNFLIELTKAEILEHRFEPDDQFRWNPSFIGSWEQPLNKEKGNN